MTPIERLRINAIKSAHALHEIGLGRLDQQVIVIIHQAICVAASILLRDLFTEQLEKPLSVDVIDKDVGSSVASRGQVIKRSGKFQP